MRGWTVAFAATLGLTLGSPAAAAGPWYMRIDGEALSSPIVLNWQENDRLFTALAAAPPASLAGNAFVTERPSLRLSLYWGARWGPYAPEPVDTSKLRPEEADGSGRLFPAACGEPAAMTIDGVGFQAREVTPEMAALLQQRGVPLSLPEDVAECGGGSLSIRDQVLISLAGVGAVLLAPLALGRVLRAMNRPA